MQLNSIKYSEFAGEPQEWILENLSIGSKTLLVGKNSTGKSRTLSVIHALAGILSGLQKATRSAKCESNFEHNGNLYKYEFECKDGQVTLERLFINGQVKLNRYEGGVGEIFAEQLTQELKIEKELKFQTPPSDFAVVSRRDTIQHGFLEPLHAWGESVRCYHFGLGLGKTNFAIFQPCAPKVNDRDENAVVGLFKAGLDEFGKVFVNNIKEDMEKVGYEISEVSVGSQFIFQYAPNVPSATVGLSVREKGLDGITDQTSMSAGMYRVLALLIHVNYLALKSNVSCILIDDIGEGLDFERSCQIIHLLRHKAEHSRLQIVMSTNDRFVMDEVPLEEWAVLQRYGSKVRVRNIENSRQAFVDFKFTGLSNFSFFELNVVDGNSEDENSDNA